MASQVNFTKHLEKRVNTYHSQTITKNAEKGMLPKTFTRPASH